MKEADARKAQGRRLAQARKSAGYRSAREAALDNNWAESTYRTHEAGTRTIGLDDAERYAKRFRRQGVEITAQQILFGDDEDQNGENTPGDPSRSVFPIMGYIGAGAEIEPDYEQVPADGLDQVELPLLLSDEVIGLLVRGDSMLPKYADGTVIVVHSQQGRATTSLIGDEVAVRTYDGRRFLKVLMPGVKPHHFNLESFNARPILGVRIAWASEVIAIIPASQVRRAARPSRKSGARTATRKGDDSGRRS
jgi:phage repressor protein C with HTH and peptisase S24 domain